jgi:hypothetical protein
MVVGENAPNRNPGIEGAKEKTSLPSALDARVRSSRVGPQWTAFI